MAAFDEQYVRSRRSIAPWLRLDARRNLRAIRSVAPPPGRLLEVGCSTGEFCVSARGAGYHAEGLELSPAASTFARTEYGLTVLTSPIETFIREASYDVVVAIHTLEHFAAPLPALEAMWRALKPGGFLFLEVPSAVSWAVGLLGEESGIFTDEHLYFHTPHSLRLLLRNAGFHVVNVRTVEAYAGLLNGLLTSVDAHALIARVRSLVRGRSAPQPGSQAAVETRAREHLVDAGRNMMIGSAMLTGLAASPLRWLLGSAGLGGSVTAFARKTEHEDLQRPT